MAKARHPYFDLIQEELALLGEITPRSMFGHQGYAIGSSVLAFLDDEALVVKTEKFIESPGSLPKGLHFFMPDIFPSRTWVAIEFDDSLRSLKKHWSLIEESYNLASQRDILKKSKPKRKSKKKLS